MDTAGPCRCRGEPANRSTAARIGSPNPDASAGRGLISPRMATPAALSRWPIVHGLLGRLVHAFRGDQHDGLARYHPGLVDGEGDSGGRNVVRQIDNGVNVDIAERKIKGLELAADAFDHLGGGRAARGAP